MQEMGAARDAQEEARAQLDAVHAQAAHMEAERSSREVELQAVKVSTRVTCWPGLVVYGHCLILS